jgi:hypothetical protein
MLERQLGDVLPGRLDDLEQRQWEQRRRQLREREQQRRQHGQWLGK